MTTSDETKVHAIFKFTIDSKPFQSHHQFITGAEIKKLGNLPADYDVFLKERGNEEDKMISDDERVDLSSPGVEHFYGCKIKANYGSEFFA